MKVKKLPSGKYNTYICLGTDSEGKRIRKSVTADTSAECKRLANKLLYEHKESKSNPTVSQAIDQYIESSENILSPTTIEKYRCIQRNDFQSIMNVNISKLDNKLVQNAINKEIAVTTRRGTPKKAKTIQCAFSLIMTAIHFIDKRIEYDVKLPRKTKEFRQIPSAETIIRIFKDTDLELPVLLALWKGLRVSEIRGLKKSAIHNGIADINNIIVTVKTEHIEKQIPKTDSTARSILLSSYLLHLIENTEGEYITTLTGNAIYKRFTRTLSRYGIEGVRFHDLRHMSASIGTVLGVPDRYIAEYGGWSGTQTLKSVYQHTYETELEKTSKKYDDYFENILKNATKMSYENSESEK